MRYDFKPYCLVSSVCRKRAEVTGALTLRHHKLFSPSQSPESVLALFLAARLLPDVLSSKLVLSGARDSTSQEGDRSPSHPANLQRNTRAGIQPGGRCCHMCTHTFSGMWLHGRF